MTRINRVPKIAKSWPILILCLLLPLGGASAAGTAGTAGVAKHKATFDVRNMTCEGCSQGLTASLVKLPGVKIARVSFPEQRAFVQYDARATNPAKLMAFFKRAGFPATLSRRRAGSARAKRQQ